MPGAAPSPASELPKPHDSADVEASIARYERGAARLRAACGGLSAEQANRRVGPGTWSVQEVAVHLLDSDLAATHRMRRIAAEDQPLLVAYDENAFIARLPADRLDLGEVLAAFEANRRFTARWLRTLAPGDFARTGIHTERGKVTLGEIVSTYAWHVDHHLAFVEGKRRTLGIAG